MHERGVRGVRCNLINPGGLSPAAVAALATGASRDGLARRVSHLPVDQLAGWADVVESFDIPVVVDHMGRPTPGRVDPLSPALAQLIELRPRGTMFREAVRTVSAVRRDTARERASRAPKRDH